MRCDGRCGISSISVETKRMASDGLQTQTLDLSLVRQPLVGPDLPKKLSSLLRAIFQFLTPNILMS